MKKIILISGIVAITLTTASADFSFTKMYEELKAVAEATDVNVSNIDTDKNVSVDVTTEVNNEKESMETNNSTVENVSDENITETSTEENK